MRSVNDQHVHRCLRIDIAKSNGCIRLENLCEGISPSAILQKMQFMTFLRKPGDIRCFHEGRIITEKIFTAV
jgi:hypothetical protein